MGGGTYMEINQWSVIYQPNFIDVSSLVESPPKERGVISYKMNGAVEKISDETEIGKPGGIRGCFARYKYPKYKEVYFQSKRLLENLIGEKLHPTYYYDRFYFPGQELKKHIDRPACEISISVNISSNLNYDWNLNFEVDGEKYSLPTKPGDAVVYKGMQIPHWRDKLKGNSKNYYHQFFMHFVRANGHYVEYTNDLL